MTGIGRAALTAQAQSAAGDSLAETPLGLRQRGENGKQDGRRAQCPVVAIPPPALVGELGHGRLAWAFWRRSLTPEQVLRDQGRRAA